MVTHSKSLPGYGCNLQRRVVVSTSGYVKPVPEKLSLTLWSVIVLAIPALAGCDPVVAIAGAQFPDWLVCVIVGTALAAACHPLLKLGGLESYLRPLPFFYGCLIVMFSLATWVIFFNRV